MPFEIIRDDITKLKVNAIVNSSNNSLQNDGGICGAIFMAAGADKLQKACKKIGTCQTGQAVITKGYSLPAKYIIHTAAPAWSGGNGEQDLLYSCYKNSLELAKKKKCKSVAFSLISYNAHDYPKDQVLRVATTAIGDFLLGNDMAVSLVVPDKDVFLLSEKLYFSIKAVVDDYSFDALSNMSRQLNESLTADAALRPLYEKYRSPKHEAEIERSYAKLSQSEMRPASFEPCCQSSVPTRSLKDVVGQLDETFSERLLRLIDEKGRTDIEVYKRANIDRRVFSRIRSHKDYKPSKNTALAFAVALELSLDDTSDLLRTAGFALSKSNVQDKIVEYFIKEGIYNIFEINEALFAFDQTLLGA